MKTTAYISDCCRKLLDENNVMGIIYEPDIFIINGFYKTVKPDKSNIHYCIRCYNFNVTEAVKKLIDKSYTMEEIDRKKHEMAYLFKSSVYNKKYTPNNL